MTETLHARAKGLFLAALEQPAAERSAFVARGCGADAALKAEVESLLACHVEQHARAVGESGLLVPHRARDVPEPEGLGRVGRVASHVVSRAAHRLEVVSLVTFVAIVVLWFVVNVLRGQLGTELTSLYQWGPPVTALVASAAMLAAARSRRLPPSSLVRIGLVYEVVVSFAVTGGAYLGAFEGLSATDIVLDRVGLSYVAPWTLFFTVLVPTPPRDALVALVVSASAVPLVYLEQVWVGKAPALDISQFLPIFVWPYAVGTVLAYIAARVVHQLGVEVRRAHELGGYRLEVRLGRGGMGEVWRGTHRLLARPAAIKVIRREALAADPASAESAMARFEQEAQVIASLQSPHTVELYDFGRSEDGALYYAMELLDGLDLDQCVRRFGPMPPERVVYLLRQACESLAEAHQRGLVHRDVKPSNLFVCRRGLEYDVVKVLDFGLVKRAVALDGAAPPLLAADGAVAGTPEFMAPEMVAEPGHVDSRADIYAMGCVAYFLLTGVSPFGELAPAAAMRAHLHEQPLSLGATASGVVPPGLDVLVLDCLAKDRARRPQTAEVLSQRLATAVNGATWTGQAAKTWWLQHRIVPAE
ncbi:MAG: serine/threonine protein kinase [Acidobacteria bacterium]|nr:serine/threonine protein kinase [Acidobacteriota bacterium]